MSNILNMNMRPFHTWLKQRYIVQESKHNFIQRAKITDPFQILLLSTHKLKNLDGINSPEELDVYLNTKVLLPLTRKTAPGRFEISPEKTAFALDDTKINPESLIRYAHNIAGNYMMVDAAKYYIEYKKMESFKPWRDYLMTGNPIYNETPSFIILMMLAILKTSGSSSMSPYPPLNEGAVSQIYEKIKNSNGQQFNILKTYKKFLKERSKNVKQTSGKYKWASFESMSDLDELAALSSNTNWCTDSPTNARYYLGQGPNYMLFDGDSPKVLVTVERDSKDIYTMGGRRDYQLVEPQYLEEMISFLKDKISEKSLENLYDIFDYETNKNADFLSLEEKWYKLGEDIPEFTKFGNIQSENSLKEYFYRDESRASTFPDVVREIISMSKSKSYTLDAYFCVNPEKQFAIISTTKNFQLDSSDEFRFFAASHKYDSPENPNTNGELIDWVIEKLNTDESSLTEGIDRYHKDMDGFSRVEKVLESVVVPYRETLKNTWMEMTDKFTHIVNIFDGYGGNDEIQKLSFLSHVLNLLMIKPDSPEECEVGYFYNDERLGKGDSRMFIVKNKSTGFAKYKLDNGSEGVHILTVWSKDKIAELDKFFEGMGIEWEGDSNSNPDYLTKFRRFTKFLHLLYHNQLSLDQYPLRDSPMWQNASFFGLITPLDETHMADTTISQSLFVQDPFWHKALQRKYIPDYVFSPVDQYPQLVSSYRQIREYILSNTGYTSNHNGFPNRIVERAIALAIKNITVYRSCSIINKALENRARCVIRKDQMWLDTIWEINTLIDDLRNYLPTKYPVNLPRIHDSIMISTLENYDYQMEDIWEERVEIKDEFLRLMQTRQTGD